MASALDAVRIADDRVLTTIAWLELSWAEPRLETDLLFDYQLDPAWLELQSLMIRLGFEEDPSTRRSQRARMVQVWHREDVEIINVPLQLASVEMPDYCSLVERALDVAGIPYHQAMSNSMWYEVPTGCSTAARKALAEVPELRPYLPGPPCD